MRSDALPCWEYAQQRGLIADPTRPRRPRDKPRVERSVPYVRERFFKGAQFRDLAEMRLAARRWCLEVAGQRIHGTTRRRPLEVFEQEERSARRPGSGSPMSRSTGARPRSIPTTTSPASTRSTRCPPRSVHPASESRFVWA